VDPLYWRLTHDRTGRYGGPIPGGDRFYDIPQVSKYVRAFQARQSLFIWKLLGGRLDGRLNGDLTDDCDYLGGPMPPPGSPQLTGEEKRLMTRWIDLGAPTDLPGRLRNRYTDDAFLPVLTVAEPRRGDNPLGWDTIVLGLFDSESGIDEATLSVVLDMDVTGFPMGTNLTPLATFNGDRSIATIVLPGISQGVSQVPNQEHSLDVSVDDLAGNHNREQRVFVLK